MASVRPMSLVGCVNSVCIILGLVGNTCCWSGRRRSLNHAKKEKHFPNGWKAAAEAGQIYGWESFKRRGLYSPGTRPVICRNVVDYNRVNLTTGSKYYYNFVICPPPDTNETFNACCGRDDDHMKCCNVDLSYVLATAIIMAMVLTCLLCCCCGLVIYIFTARGPKHGAVLQPGPMYGAVNPPAYSTYPQPGYHQPGYPQPGYPQPGYHQPGNSQPTYPRPDYPQPGKPQTAPSQDPSQAAQSWTSISQPGYPQPSNSKAYVATQQGYDY